MNDRNLMRSLLGSLVCLALVNHLSAGSPLATSPVTPKDSPDMQTTVSPALDDRLTALKALKIDAATITLVEHDVSPTLVTPDGQTHNNLPPRTVVKMVLTPAKGSTINVEICMPDAEKWNGRLLGLGNGGAAGHINSLGLCGPVSGGYVAATTDMGTAPNADSGIGNKEVWKDFGFRATHLMTVAAKQVVRAYYGTDIAYSYFVGGSTGGQQALQEAQRYPDDYDGIVANIPAHCRTPLHAYFLWNYQILAKCPFTQAQEKTVVDAGNEYMANRESPPVAGKFVSDPRCNSKDIEAVIALALQKDSTLTQAHADALRKIFGGPTHAITHERIFDGLPIGASFDGCSGNLYLFEWVFGKSKPLLDIDFGKDFDTYTAALGPYLNAENPDLTAFEKRGGKLIVVAGSADPVVPYPVSIDYYERVIERFGSLARVQLFFKFYIAPGMAHGGGPGINRLPDLLAAVRAWREQGDAPSELQGQSFEDGKVVLTMPLYPYPSKTGWDADKSTFKQIDGPRGGVDRVSDRCLPPAAE